MDNTTDPALTPKEPSLHRRILEDVEGRIMSGEWPPGYRIPFEHELTAQYGCSRMTVNKALTELVKRGLIERRRKSGSFVTRPHAQSAILEIHDIEAEVRSLGLPYRYQRLSRSERTVRAADRKLLDLPAGARVVDLVVVHHAGARPFCLEERTISLSAVPEAAAEEFEQAPPGQWLLSQVPWSAAEHRIRAVAADRRVADLLHIADGAACLVIERRTWSGGAYVTHVRLTYPGESHELVAEFAPNHPKA
ncbi:histidine utilization repressor [Rhizobium sp. TRM96647]|uniref:histidine utilization repressor n=1 Tax=unclassified Rhizobium TaxID=2613769 RepID=UPI0021E83B75|nr:MULTISPECIES: histidine utilization repressor [unclassified Rhizobium]MCV3738268.1 histidine utilization repressor [Rhizobium sp. TRM96647]MCV3759983.1 histidine utilization repressor [Rhizobium sp. TRM96650]